MQRTRASFAVGLNRPVSMDEMVWRETPTSPAEGGARRLQPVAEFELAVVVMHIVESERR